MAKEDQTKITSRRCQGTLIEPTTAATISMQGDKALGLNVHMVWLEEVHGLPFGHRKVKEKTQGLMILGHQPTSLLSAHDTLAGLHLVGSRWIPTWFLEKAKANSLFIHKTDFWISGNVPVTSQRYLLPLCLLPSPSSSFIVTIIDTCRSKSHWTLNLLQLRLPAGLLLR